MLSNCNNQILQDRGIADQYYLLYQVWKELTETTTMDSYQYRIINTLSGINELSKVIEQRLSLSCNTNHNIDDCKSELGRIVSMDTTLKKHYPIIYRRLLSHLHSNTESVSQQKVLRRQLEYCYNEIIPGYFSFLFDDIEEYIALRDNNNIIQVAGRIVSCCIMFGWSSQELNIEIEVLRASEADPKKWDDFKKVLKECQAHTFTVYIPITVNAKKIEKFKKSEIRNKFHHELNDLGIKVNSQDQMKGIIGQIGGISRHLRTNYYMEVDVLAMDFYSASNMAIRKCSEALSLLSFFNLIDAWNIDNIYLLVFNKESNTNMWLSTRKLYGTYDFLDGANMLVAEAKSRVSIDTSVQRKLKAAFAYSNIGKASSSLEDKFINAWVALESLCRGDAYDNIISNVLETIPQALCTRYIYQLYRNFIEDCQHCSIEFTFSSGVLISEAMSTEERVKTIISIFKDGVLYAELLNKCKVNSLLEVRCNELYSLATDKLKMLDRIENHNTNIRYQISRLYRMRNDIAHNAYSGDESILIYIEHLDDYLANAVAEILIIAKRKEIDDIGLVYEVIRDNYQEFIELKKELKKAKKEVDAENLLKGLFETGIINLI